MENVSFGERRDGCAKNARNVTLSSVKRMRASPCSKKHSFFLNVIKTISESIIFIQRPHQTFNGFRRSAKLAGGCVRHEWRKAPRFDQGQTEVALRLDWGLTEV